SVYVQLMDYVVSWVEAKDPTAVNVKVQHDAFKQKVLELKEIFKTTQASNFSEPIIQADTWRDQLFQGVVTSVEAKTYHFDPAIRVSADLLKKNLRIYGPKITIS